MGLPALRLPRDLQNDLAAVLKGCGAEVQSPEVGSDDRRRGFVAGYKCVFPDARVYVLVNEAKGAHTGELVVMIMPASPFREAAAARRRTAQLREALLRAGAIGDS